MTKRSRHALLLALAGFAALSACGRTVPRPQGRACIVDQDCPEGFICLDGECVVFFPGDRPRGAKQFGEPCEESAECQSGYCVAGPRGGFCSQECDGECPSGFACKVMLDPIDAGVQVALCALPQPLLCQPCEIDTDCGATGADRCVKTGLFRFCAVDCTFGDCPEGYACSDVDGARQCLPNDASCDCTPSTVGRLRGCAAENPIGVCFGAQACTPGAEWGACSARQALIEDCNGFDDDCDGRTDEDLGEQMCTRQNAAGVCTGLNTCQGASGWRCEAPAPAQEACNYVDDDCDGITDDGFVDPQGRYTQAVHCGGCGNSCMQLIPNSIRTACLLNASGAPECKAITCTTGFYASPDGRTCLKLADSLCQACIVDSDCAGPGSRCVDVNGEKVCGRACALGTPFAPCPAGYTCQGPAATAQCVPVSGTCACDADQIGMTRSCSLATCSGYQTCGAGGWSACDVASFNPEQCDGADNDCDGAIDEGFRNASTGRYETTQHCGFCNNDCTKYWSPTLQHTTGVCDAAAAFPVCKMGPCTTEVVGGVMFEWRNVNGDTSDGCECRRVQGNTTVDDPQELAPFVDENCDGVDGVAADAIFVWTGAAGVGNGTITAPFKTVGQAVSALTAPGATKRYALVAEGLYTENVALGPGVRLYGGYSRDFQKRDPLLFTSTIRGTVPASATAAQAAVHARGIGSGAAQAAMAGFTIQGVDRTESTADNQDGAPSYAVLVEDSSASLRIVGNEISAGRGGRGGRGSTGTQGFGRQVSTALNGGNGVNSLRQFAPCPSTVTRPGGSAGTNATCGFASANAGGSSTCPTFNWAATPVQGGQAPYPPGSGRNGEGGFHWSFDTQSFPQCNHVTESGFPSNIQTHDGRDGQAGPDGSSGSGGAGGPSASRHGSIAANRWTASTFAASGGAAGALGLGGGGGGAGGGTARHPMSPCQRFEFGATGGGGGAGGCGGSGGLPGRPGGASIALMVTYSSTPSGNQLPVIQSNRIERNLGGDGGNGGFGGAGGRGGLGGFPGTNSDWSGSTGGRGGDGGNGGPGGGGGGGAGGPSFGILGFRVNASTWSAGNTFLTPATSSTGGQGGAGGSSSGAGATGAPGVGGASANVLSLSPCAAGCGAGTVCDANGVCVPQ